MTGNNTLENEYTEIVLKIRNAFKNSILPSSDRWYAETQSLELAYVPVFSGVHSPVVYSIPFYKLLDTEESRIAKPMFPCEIEPALAKEINAGEILNSWVDAMRKLGEIKLYIQRYQQVMQVPADEKCLCSLTSFTESLIEQIKLLWKDLLLAEDIVNEMIKEVDEQNGKLLNIVQLFFDCYEEIESVIRNQNDPGELIQIIETVSLLMFALQPFVSAYAVRHEYS